MTDFITRTRILCNEFKS